MSTDEEHPYGLGCCASIIGLAIFLPCLIAVVIPEHMTKSTCYVQSYSSRTYNCSFGVNCQCTGCSSTPCSDMVGKSGHCCGETCKQENGRCKGDDSRCTRVYMLQYCTAAQGTCMYVQGMVFLHTGRPINFENKCTNDPECQAYYTERFGNNQSTVPCWHRAGHNEATFHPRGQTGSYKGGIAGFVIGSFYMAFGVLLECIFCNLPERSRRTAQERRHQVELGATNTCR